ncbi:MAG: thiosulfate-binding protein SoxY [Chlorobiaceae bacterium]|jgi:sulfur-oxidizing protein SoxY|nr:thiosulfate-binding protein SoxY [Chlorobiaceae bacterium]
MDRRQFLAFGALFAGYSLALPAKLFAEWSANSFRQDSIEQAFINALGTKEMVKTDKISIVAPVVATDGSMVPVEVISELKGTRIFLFVEKNVTPLVFVCDLHENALPWFSLNIKMKESSTLYAVVRDGGKYFMSSVHVDVVAQAC